LAAAARDDLPTPAAYYDLLKPLCAHLDIWHTVYNHVMAGPDAIVEWFRGSALRPFLSVLNADAVVLSPNTARASRVLTRRVSTIRSCCAFRGCSLWQRARRGIAGSISRPPWMLSPTWMH
jgi:hypothetical protein